MSARPLAHRDPNTGEWVTHLPEPANGRMAVVVKDGDELTAIQRDDAIAAENPHPDERWFSSDPFDDPMTWATWLSNADAVYPVSPEPMAPVVTLEQAAKRGAE